MKRRGDHLSHGEEKNDDESSLVIIDPFGFHFGSTRGGSVWKDFGTEILFRLQTVGRRVGGIPVDIERDAFFENEDRHRWEGRGCLLV
jgi:hypothetical protein